MLDIKKVDQAFRFLDLAPEIRNKVYRLLLLSENARVSQLNPVFEESVSDSEPFKCFPGEPQGGPSSLQGVNYRISTYNFETAILRVSHLVHQEAAAIFDKNLWVIVSIDGQGFSSELKRAGYPVVSRIPVR